MREIVNTRVAEDLVHRHARVAVIGYPGAGKTTFCQRFCPPRAIFHTDAYLNHGHDERPDKIFADLKDVENFIIEGNEVTRLIKRGFKPDILILLTGRSKEDKRLNGLKGRVDKFLREYEGTLYILDARLG